jgi:hypothetical protein
VLVRPGSEFEALQDPEVSFSTELVEWNMQRY